MENKTLELCNFLTGLKFCDLSEQNILDIKYRILDYLGCVIAAKDLPVSDSVLKFVDMQGGSELSSIVNRQKKTSEINAAFVNGILSHALEYDDTNKIAITHPGAPVISAALAVAENLNSSFERVAVAIAVGYEAMIRLGGAINPSHYKSFHTTGTCGAFASAAAVSVLLELSAKEMERAFGIVSTMASGVVNVFGTDSKLVTVGNAAKNGIIAARLAKLDISAPKDAFASKKGYGMITSESQDLSYMIPKPEDALLLEDAYYKIHASCGHTHSALDALLEIMHKNDFQYEEIADIEVLVYKTSLELCGEFKVQTPSEAKFSLPYCISAMLIYGQCTLSEFFQEVLECEKIRLLSEKIHIYEKEEYTKYYPELRYSKIIIKLNCGKTLEKEVDLPVKKPSLNFLEKKFMSLAGMTISGENAIRLKESVLNLKTTDTLSEILLLLRTI